jgi:hypothetical protein
MINWMLEVEDVACPVDDMKRVVRVLSFRGGEGRSKVQGYEGRRCMQTAQGCETPILACGRVMEELRHNCVV